jgi:hypothetical protein
MHAINVTIKKEILNLKFNYKKTKFNNYGVQMKQTQFEVLDIYYFAFAWDQSSLVSNI